MSNKISILLLITLGLILGISFNVFPEIDLYFSKLFYSEETKEFVYKDNLFVRFLYYTALFITRGIIASCIILLILNLIRKKKHLLTNIQLVYIFLFAVIGPGLIVHNLFKDNWGRARPHQIQYFGGDKNFTAPLVITNQCPKNCSFPSGHAAAGFAIAAFALLYKKRRSAVIYTSGIILGMTYGMGRVLEGKHFLSDIIFSGIFVLLTAHILHYLIFDLKLFNTLNKRRK